jgi:hypothetical protein
MAHIWLNACNLLALPVAASEPRFNPLLHKRSVLLFLV